MRFLIYSTLFSYFWLVLSCSSISKYEEGVDPRSEVFLLTYKKAKTLEITNPKESCELYTALAKETDFRLNQLAHFRSQLLCQTTEDHSNVNLKIKSENPWLTPLWIEVSLKEAQAIKNPLIQAQVLSEKARASDKIREKEKLLLQAIELAKEARDQAFVSELESRLYKISPRLNPKPQPQDYIKIGQDLLSQREFKSGRDYLWKSFHLSNSTLEEKIFARKLIRNSYKVEQNKDAHITEAKKYAIWVQTLNTPPKLHEALLTLSRAQWTEGQVSEAKKTLTRAEKLLKGQHPLDEIYFIRGRMSEEAQNFEEAIHHYTRAEKEALDKSLMKDKAISYKAWSLRKIKLYQDAANSYAQLVSKAEDPAEKNKYRFWQAKSLKQAGDIDGANGLFLVVSQEDPLGYYGLLAHREMGWQLPPLDIKNGQSIKPNSQLSLNLKNQNMIRDLIYVEENQILEKFLNDQAQQLRNSSTTDPNTWLFLMKAYAQAGLYLPLFSQIGTLDSKVKENLLKDHPELLFPRKFLPLIEEWAAKFEVRPELMLAIIRQESAFDPFARSPADAFGLMQLLPSVAKHYQEKTKINIGHYEDLFAPEKNIPFGAALLASLSKKYRGQFVLTAAAYNSNEKAIQNWLKTRLKEDPLEFIEDIPYEETRGYIKLVLRNFVFYSRLKEPQKSISFPDWCLEDLQSFKESKTNMQSQNEI
ncbi:MAG: hypothetical protein BroJett040_23930 [Oligoflexia bacterium]|nr:MAG: hypothetical protein BroJett040_23930 [Oligoflexia bacterium]